MGKRRIKNHRMPREKRVFKAKDPSMTIELKNPEVEELMKIYAGEKTQENLERLLQKIRTARLLVPANLNDKKQPVPCVLKGIGEDMFLAAYTQKEQIPEEPKTDAVINMPYLALNQMAVRPEAKVTGIVLNPFTDKLVFRKQLLERISQVETYRRNVSEQIQLTPEQYVLYERKRFEFQYLPGRFFEQGKSVVEELCAEREEYVDKLFEEAYQHKRMYPYLTEDFSVMVMNISEELLIIRVDLPEKDMGVPSCWRVYFSWNPVQEKGRYFTIEKTKENGVSLLGEITGDGAHTDHGQAPVEGAELQKVIDLIRGEES